MRKILGLLFLGIFFISCVAAAADIAYIVTSNSNIKPEFTDAMNDLGLDWKIVLASEAKNYDFTQHRMFLLDDEYFSKWQDLPVNDYPGLMVNGYNMVNWGWTKRTTTASQSVKYQVNTSKEHEITEGFGEKTTVYTATSPIVYQLHKNDIYDGLEIIVSDVYDSKNAIVALAKEGTTLTKGSLSTEINADSIFFGIYRSDYWTEDAEQLFKNCLWYLLKEQVPRQDFEFELYAGENLISLPIILDESSVSSILFETPEVKSVKTYNENTELIYNSSEMYNDEGYFLRVDEPTTLLLEGQIPTGERSVSLKEGMNLVGWTSLDSKSFSEANVPDEVVEISRRNQDGTYDIATRFYNTPIWFNAFELQPSRGYWFKLNSEAVWTYSS